MPMPAGAYTMIKVGSGTGGGLMPNPIPNAPSSCIPYVGLNDVKAAAEKAKTLAAKVMREITEIPNMGSFSIITDPAGFMLGLWQSKT